MNSKTSKLIRAVCLKRRVIEHVKLAWRNWLVRDTGKAYQRLTKAMQDDPDYAHSWLCNIAMPIYDGAKGKLTIDEANVIADTLMEHLFEVKGTLHRSLSRSNPKELK